MSTADPILGRFASPTASPSTRLAILSDLHLSLDTTGTWRVAHRTEERLQAAVDSVNAQDLDAVFFAGDLVQSGRLTEFDAFDRIIDGLDAPFYAIPGNHDLIARDGQEQATLSTFERRYTPGSLPYHERIGGVDLIALNSNPSTRESVTDSYEGGIRPADLEWLDNTLAAVESPLVSIHHTLQPVRSRYVDAREQLPVTGGSPGFENDDELLDVLSRHGGGLVLTGHLHFPAVAQQGSIREFTLPSLGPFPCGYTVLDIDERGTTARFHSVGDFDDRIEAISYGHEQDRALIAAAQMAGLPLVDDLRSQTKANARPPSASR